jgi:hypothetical protein
MNARRIGILLGFALLGIAVNAPLAAQDAKGTFRFGKVQFRPVDALAYQQIGTDPARPLTTVVLADFAIDRPAVIEPIDTVRAMMQQAMKKERRDRADIEIKGTDNDGKKVNGTFAMRKIAGAWRVVEQSLYFSE